MANLKYSVPVFTAVADLVHHVKNELDAPQLDRIVCVFSAMMHKPALGYSLHVLFVKMMFGLTDVIVAKETSQGAARLLEALFRTCLEKLESLSVVHSEVRNILERNNQENSTPDLPDTLLIEKARPVSAAVYAVEKPEEVIHGQNFCANNAVRLTLYFQNREWFLGLCFTVSARALLQ